MADDFDDADIVFSDVEEPAAKPAPGRRLQTAPVFRDPSPASGRPPLPRAATALTSQPQPRTWGAARPASGPATVRRGAPTPNPGGTGAESLSMSDISGMSGSLSIEFSDDNLSRPHAAVARTQAQASLPPRPDPTAAPPRPGAPAPGARPKSARGLHSRGASSNGGDSSTFEDTPLARPKTSHRSRTQGSASGSIEIEFSADTGTLSISHSADYDTDTPHDNMAATQRMPVTSGVKGVGQGVVKGAGKGAAETEILSLDGRPTLTKISSSGGALQAENVQSFDIDFSDEDPTADISHTGSSTHSHTDTRTHNTVAGMNTLRGAPDNAQGSPTRPGAATAPSTAFRTGAGLQASPLRAATAGATRPAAGRLTDLTGLPPPPAARARTASVPARDAAPRQPRPSRTPDSTPDISGTSSDGEPTHSSPTRTNAAPTAAHTRPSTQAGQSGSAQRAASRSSQQQRQSAADSADSSDSGRPKLMTMDQLEAMSSVEGSIAADSPAAAHSAASSSGSSDGRPKLMTMDQLQAASSVSASSRSSSHGRPKLLTMADLADMDASVDYPGVKASGSDSWDRTRVDSVQRGDGSNRDSGKGGSAAIQRRRSGRSTRSGGSAAGSDDDWRPKVMTMDQLQAADSAADSHSSPHSSSDGRPKVLTMDQLQAASSLSASSRSGRSRSRRSSSSDGRPRVLTMDQLQAASSVSSGGDSKSSNGSDSDRSNGRPKIMRMEDLMGIEAAVDGMLEGTQPSESSGQYSQSFASERSSTPHRHYHQASSSQDMSHSADMSSSVGSGSGGGESVRDIGRMGPLGSVSPVWQTNDTVQQGNGHTQQGHVTHVTGTHTGVATHTVTHPHTVQASSHTPVPEEWAGPRHSRVTSQQHSHMVQPTTQTVDYRPAQGSGVPAAVFGAPHLSFSHSLHHPHTTHTGPHNTVATPASVPMDMAPHGPHAHARSVSVQVGSMNEVSTQVAYDPLSHKLIDNVTLTPPTHPTDLPGLTSAPRVQRHTRPHTAGPVLGSTAAGMGPGAVGLGLGLAGLSPAERLLHELTHSAIGSGSGASLVPPTHMGILGTHGLPMSGQASTAIDALTQALSHMPHVGHASSSGIDAVGLSLGVPPGPPAGLLGAGIGGGGGWGVLSMAVQNLKAAALLEQVEKTSVQLRQLAELAALSVTGDSGSNGRVDAASTQPAPQPAAAATAVSPRTRKQVPALWGQGGLQARVDAERTHSDTLVSPGRVRFASDATDTSIKVATDVGHTHAPSAVHVATHQPQAPVHPSHGTVVPQPQAPVRNTGHTADSTGMAQSHMAQQQGPVRTTGMLATVESSQGSIATDSVHDSMTGKDSNSGSGSSVPDETTPPHTATHSAADDHYTTDFDSASDASAPAAPAARTGSTLAARSPFAAGMPGSGGAALARRVSMGIVDVSGHIGGATAGGTGHTTLQSAASLRRTSVAGERLGLLIPEHNMMDVLPSKQIPTAKPASPTHKPHTHHAHQHTTGPTGDKNNVGGLQSSRVQGGVGDGVVCESGVTRECGVATDDAFVTLQRREMANAARDTLIRYHQLLSSGALPGSLLSHHSIQRLKSELVAGAAAAAATSGIGYNDVIRETSSNADFRSQLARIQSQMATMRIKYSTPSHLPSHNSPQTNTATTPGLTPTPTGYPFVSTTAGAGGLGLMHGQVAAGAGGVHGFTHGSIAGAGAVGTGGGREVMVDRLTRKLVDVGPGSGGGLSGGQYKYTTLEETMQFIRAYRPASLSDR